MSTIAYKRGKIISISIDHPPPDRRVNDETPRPLATTRRIRSKRLTYDIIASEEGRHEDREAILRPLIEYNRQNGPPADYRMLALLLKDPAGQVIGGLWGRSSYEWLFIELLFIPEALRRAGLGRTLMLQAESLARERKCTGLWVDTFDFQARPFYEKLGYTVFGRLDDHPRGISQYWLQKRID